MAAVGMATFPSTRLGMRRLFCYLSSPTVSLSPFRLSGRIACAHVPASLTLAVTILTRLLEVASLPVREGDCDGDRSQSD